MARDGFTIGSFAFAREPVEKIGGIGNLAEGFRKRFALFGGYDGGEIMRIFAHQPAPRAQYVAPFDGQPFAPVEKGFAGGIDCDIDIVERTGCHAGEVVAGGRIDNAQFLVTRHPCPIKIGTMLDQIGPMQTFQRRAGDIFHEEAPFLFARSLAARHHRSAAFVPVFAQE